MSAYVVALVTVTDPVRFKDYAAAAGPAAAKFGGRYLARGGEMSLLEGDLDRERIVVIEFKDKATAEAWYNSPEYQAARALRDGAAIGTFIAVEGA